MADNFLERHRDEYEQRKQAWLKRKRHGRPLRVKKKGNISRPDDEAL